MLNKFQVSVLCAFVFLGLQLLAQEVSYPKDAYGMLDTFEAHSLRKADKAFNDRNYRQAVAEYDVFIRQFERSKAISYALLRKGRALHLDNKRFEAIASYQEVLDYFPDDVPFAAPAIYYIGLSHQQNGDLEKALGAWVKMADDEDYAKHILAAPAIYEIAENLLKQENYDRAMKFYEQVVGNFRTSNWNVALNAINKMAWHFIRRNPNEPAFRDLYQKAQGIGRHPIKSMPEDLAADFTYWNTLRSQVDAQERHFNQFQQEERRAFYRYWAGAMGGRFPDNDDYQISLAQYRRRFEDDAERKWVEFLDRQYATDVNRGGYHQRIFKWLPQFKGNAAKIEEYYGKCRFSEMKNDEIIALMKILFENLDQPKMAANVFEKLRFNEMEDKDKAALSRYLWDRDERLVLLACAAMSDEEQGNLGRLRYFHYKRNSAHGIPVAEKLTSSPDHAEEAWWKIAEFHSWSKNWQEAINAYRKSEKLPDGLWRISSCYVQLGKLSEAIAALREIENFFKDHSSEAALRISYVYRDAGQRTQQVAALRQVLQKYPKSKQSSTAHLELEKLGETRIGGGMIEAQ